MPKKLTKVAPKRVPGTTGSTSTSAKRVMAASTAVPAALTRSTKRVRADSIVDVDETRPKRAKGDIAAIEAAGTTRALARSEPQKPRILDKGTEETLVSLRELLIESEHNKRSMGAIMDAIEYDDIRPDAVEDMIEAVLDLLKDRALSGKAIWYHVDAIEMIDERHANAEYDAEPVSEEVQDRLDAMAGMVRGLSKTFLKDVNKGIGSWGNGTNSEMAADIVETLGSRANGGSDLLDEYQVIKSVYRSCWGGCGGSSDEEEEEEEEW